MGPGLQPSAHLSRVRPPGSPTRGGGSPRPRQAGSPRRLRSLAASGAARRWGQCGICLALGSTWWGQGSTGMLREIMSIKGDT